MAVISNRAHTLVIGPNEMGGIAGLYSSSACISINGRWLREKTSRIVIEDARNSRAYDREKSIRTAATLRTMAKCIAVLAFVFGSLPHAGLAVFLYIGAVWKNRKAEFCIKDGAEGAYLEQALKRIGIDTSKPVQVPQIFTRKSSEQNSDLIRHGMNEEVIDKDNKQRLVYTDASGRSWFDTYDASSWWARSVRKPCYLNAKHTHYIEDSEIFARDLRLPILQEGVSFAQPMA